MAEQKTKPTNAPVEDFVAGIENEEVRDDCLSLIKLMRNVTKEPPRLWGGNIVGFGTYHYKYDSGHEGYSCLTGFSPRKQNISLYIMPGYASRTDLLNKLGKHKAGKGCLYVKRLSDINIDVLEQLIRDSVEWLRKTYPS